MKILIARLVSGCLRLFAKLKIRVGSMVVILPPRALDGRYEVVRVTKFALSAWSTVNVTSLDFLHHGVKLTAILGTLY